jgi:hypothetical protein
VLATCGTGKARGCERGSAGRRRAPVAKRHARRCKSCHVDHLPIDEAAVIVTEVAAVDDQRDETVVVFVGFHEPVDGTLVLTGDVSGW